MATTGYVFGEDVADTRDGARKLVEDYVANQLDNGPGWVVTTNGHAAYDIEIHVTLRRK